MSELSRDPNVEGTGARGLSQLVLGTKLLSEIVESVQSSTSRCPGDGCPFDRISVARVHGCDTVGCEWGALLGVESSGDVRAELLSCSR